jgi:hypothetical protein
MSTESSGRIIATAETPTYPSPTLLEWKPHLLQQNASACPYVGALLAVERANQEINSKSQNLDVKLKAVRIHFFSAVSMRFPLLWDITQIKLVVVYRRFGVAYRYQSLRVKTSLETTCIRSITIQKGEDLKLRKRYGNGKRTANRMITRSRYEVTRGG